VCRARLTLSTMRIRGRFSCQILTPLNPVPNGRFTSASAATPVIQAAGSGMAVNTFQVQYVATGDVTIRLSIVSGP
jgi:hypothetical protein